MILDLLEVCRTCEKAIVSRKACQSLPGRITAYAEGANLKMTYFSISSSSCGAAVLVLKWDVDFVAFANIV
jgi:hypothetical protein